MFIVVPEKGLRVNFHPHAQAWQQPSRSLKTVNQVALGCVIERRKEFSGVKLLFPDRIFAECNGLEGYEIKAVLEPNQIRALCIQSSLKPTFCKHKITQYQVMRSLGRHGFFSHSQLTFFRTWIGGAKIRLQAVSWRNKLYSLRYTLRYRRACQFLLPRCQAH